MSQDSTKTKDRGRSRVRSVRDVAGVGQRSGSKRFRGSSDELGRDPSHERELDPDYLIDKLLGSLSTDESLLERFIQHLFQLPGIQSKITEQMSVAATVAANAATPNASTTGEETVSVGTATTLAQSMEKLAVAVSKLNTDLAKSNQRCDDLEQYSRRNNIIISNVPVNYSSTLESQVCNIVNNYVTTPIEPTDIERTHRVYRKASKTTSDRPPDIIVKFQSYRTRAQILTKDPMEQLKEENKSKPDNAKIYISEDLTKARKELFFKTRTLRKKGYIKSTFPRDGKIVVNFDANTRWFITSQADLESMCAKFNIPVPELKGGTRRLQSPGGAMDFESISHPVTQDVPDPDAGIFQSQVPGPSHI